MANNKHYAATTVICIIEAVFQQLLYLTKIKEINWPVCSLAVIPVMTYMPEPTMAPMPTTIRSKMPRHRCRFVSDVTESGHFVLNILRNRDCILLLHLCSAQYLREKRHITAKNDIEVNDNQSTIIVNHRCNWYWAFSVGPSPIHSLAISLSGPLAPWPFHSLAISFPGPFVPWPFRSGNEFGTNRKLICDFLLVINTNLAPILRRFWDIAFETSKIVITGCGLRSRPQQTADTIDERDQCIYYIINLIHHDVRHKKIQNKSNLIVMLRSVSRSNERHANLSPLWLFAGTATVKTTVTSTDGQLTVVGSPRVAK